MIEPGEQEVSSISEDMDALSTLQSFVSEARSKLVNRDNNIRRWRKIYEMDHYDPAALSGLEGLGRRIKNQYSYVSNAPTNIVDLTVGMMAHNELSFNAYTYIEDSSTQPRSGLMERLCQGVITMNSIEQEIDIHHDVVHNATIDGGVAVRCVWSDKGLQEKEEVYTPLTTLQQITNRMRQSIGKPGVVADKKPAYIIGCPIKLHVIPLSHMLYLPGGPKGRWLMVAYQNKRSLGDIRSEFPEFRQDVTRIDELNKTKVDFLDIWYFNSSDDDHVWNAIIADNRLLRNQDMSDEYDDIPYTIAFFRPHDTEDLSLLGLGAIFTVEDAVRIEEDRISHQMRTLDITSNLPIITKTRDGRQVQVDAVFGQTINITTEESIGFLTPQNEPADNDKLLAHVANDVQMGSYSPISYGYGTSRMAGYAVSQLLDASKTRLQQPTRQIEMLWTVTMRKALTLFRRYAPDKALQLFGHYKGRYFAINTLMGGDTEGWFVNAKLNTHYPQDDQRNASLGNQAAAMKILSRRTIQEKYYGIDDPDEENERILYESLVQNPQVMQMVLQDAAERFGWEFPMGEQGGQGSPPRLPIHQNGMSGPESGIQPPQAIGGQAVDTTGDQQRLESMLAAGHNRGGR